MKILFIADPLSSLKLKSDSSLFLAKAYLEKGAEIYWAASSSLELFSYEIRVTAGKLNGGMELSISTQKFYPVESFDLVWIRKDPPFDENYLKMCWLLASLEGQVQFFNRPSLLGRYHEKMLPLEALQGGFISKNEVLPSCLLSRPQIAEEFCNAYPSEKYVVKPWLGYAGHSVHIFTKQELLKFKWAPQENWILQNFLPEIFTEGDRRVLYWKGEYLGSFVRKPKEGSAIANLAQGGSAEIKEPTREQKLLIAKVGKFLEKVGIDFAGADLIGNKLNEINITSPTGLVTYFDLNSENLAKKIVA